MGCAFERDREAGTKKMLQTTFIDTVWKRFNVTSTSPIPASHAAVLRPREDDEMANGHSEKRWEA